MRAADMQNQLREEMRHIPRGSLSQNELRMVYAIQRQHDLAEDPAFRAQTSLERAVASVRNRDHAFTPAFDAVFFSVGSV